MSKQRPNILLLFTDQQRYDALGAMGNPHIRTPNLDELASRGALFSKTYCNSPVCMPSRQSMMTGRYPAETGCTANGIEMRDDMPTLAHMLAEHGYHTANFGKLHFTNHATRDHSAPHPHFGFDELELSDEPGCYDDAYIQWVTDHDPDAVEACRCAPPPAVSQTSDRPPRALHHPYVFEGPEHLTHSAFVADRTIEFIKRRKTNAEPFFAVAGFYAPHCPLNPPKWFVRMYDPDTLPAPVMNEGENILGLTTEQWRRVKQFYYALISHVDDQVGKILKALDDAGLRERTVVIFTSDHGEHLGDHGLVAKGPPGYEPVLRVPLIVDDPGTPGGIVRNELIELVDVAPTILDCAEVPVPDGLSGRSLRPLLTQSPHMQWRESIYSEHREPGGKSWKMMRTHRYKYAVCSDGQELLFDLDEDPHELNNRAGNDEDEALAGRMRRMLIDRWINTEAPPRHKTGPY